jgi:putative membrane protein
MSVWTPLVAETDWDHMDMGGAWWILMVTGMVLFSGLVILGIVWLVRDLAGGRLDHDGPAANRGPDALATLDARLAAGDISPEEYRERRDLLRERHSPGD